MKPTPAPKEFNLPLVPAAGADRLATLERMRGKLAGRSQDLVAREAARRRMVRRKTLAWGWRISLAVLFLGGNAFLIGLPDGEAPLQEAKVKAAPAVDLPKNLGVNDQALYWTYALYDFGRLKSRFGARENAVVDAGLAKARLRELLPKVDRRTRFVIEGYLPKEGRKA